MVNAMFPGTVGPVGIALAFALIVCAVVFALGPVSGAHINPAVTLALWSIKAFPGSRVVPYVGAQCLGAVGASGLSRLALGTAGSLGATIPAVPFTTAFGVEVLLSFVLMVVIMAARNSGPESRMPEAGVIGLTVGCCALVGGPLTGASMNPARSLGPALVGGYWSAHWLYWLAPIAAMIAAARGYELLRPSPGARRP